MLKNYIKIAWRNLIKNKQYAVINICGLAIGIACCLLIGGYVYQELRYDSFHENSDQIYRALINISGENNYANFARTPKPLAPFLKDHFPEVKHAVRLMENEGVVRVGNQLFEQQFLVAEQGFFQMFDFQLLRGNAANVLQQRNEILLIKSLAQKYFGSANVIGERIELRIEGEYYPATVGGILQSPPPYSSISFQLIIPLEFWKRVDPEGFARGNNWRTLRPVTYVMLEKNTTPDQLETKIANVRKNLLPDVAKYRSVELQPITAVHFDTSTQGGLAPAANISFVYISIGIAFLILVIACINFTAISVANSTKRAREVGMRKAVGAYRRQVMAQFWSETILVVLFSLVLGLVLTELLAPWFSMMTGQPLVLNWFQNPILLALIAGIVIITGVMAGSYPALYLSKFQPSQIFRNKIGGGSKHFTIRSLTCIQFALTVILIISTLFMNEQMDLIRNKNLGFNDEFVIKTELPFFEGDEIIADLRSLLSSQTAVKSAAASTEDFNKAGVTLQPQPVKWNEKEIMAQALRADPYFLETLQIELKKGRELRRNASTSPVKEVLVNESFVKSAGWENPIGKTISLRFTFKNAEIVGIVKDFHYQSLHQPIGPLVLFPSDYYTAAYIRIGKPVSESINEVEEAWKKAAPVLPFNYTFLDETIQQQYQADKRWAQIVESASAVAIFLACMGLFGLAMLAAAKRSKEISIRKVLGATVTELTVMLSKDFLKPVAVAFVVAIPAAYLLMQTWLQNFAYKIELGFLTFFIAIVLTLFIALATVSWQSIRAALANPVDSLRSE